MDDVTIVWSKFLYASGMLCRRRHSIGIHYVRGKNAIKGFLALLNALVSCN